MPTQVLDGDNEAHLTPSPLSVTLGTAGSLAMFALGAAAEGGVDQGVITPRPGMLVLPRIGVRTVVSVRPVGSAVFAQGSVVSITVAAEGNTHPDPERVVISQIDLSGLPYRELVTLAPRNGLIVATSSAEERPVDLGTFAEAARFSARELLGVEKVDATSAINVVIAIDPSASMLGFTRDGTIGRIVELLVGVSQVVAPGRQVEAAIVTDPITWIGNASASQLGQAIRQVQDAAPLTTGFRAGHRGLLGRAPAENTLTYVITDSVPADYPELASADEIDGEARHLVLLGDPSLASLTAGLDVSTTIVNTARLQRLENPGEGYEMKMLISSLLRGCFVPGTEYARRVTA